MAMAGFFLPTHPPSPGRGPVNLSECIEELVRFSLSLSAEGDPEVELGLSKDFVNTLLAEDTETPEDDFLPFGFYTESFSQDAGGGVPRYPLYKQLSMALLSCLVSGTLARASHTVSWVNEDETSSRADEWVKLITENGRNLVNMLQAVKFELHVQEPYYSQLKAGMKTVEGRCAVGEYKCIAPGSLLLINKSLLLEVQDVNFYGSFSEMIETEGLANVLPGIQTIEEGVQVYRKFYTEHKEKSSGVVGINVSKSPSQPYISIASIVSGLSYRGVGRLLGLTCTCGTAADALPPPRSALISSFLAPHNPPSSSLTVGARALAKHVHRSSSQWWGDLRGNDSDKNKHATNVVNHLIAYSDWVNIHFVKPYEWVFEIRVSKGYGARWSKNGLKKDYPCMPATSLQMETLVEQVSVILLRKDPGGHRQIGVALGPPLAKACNEVVQGQIKGKEGEVNLRKRPFCQA